jgi:hypothetical protein
LPKAATRSIGSIGGLPTGREALGRDVVLTVIASATQSQGSPNQQPTVEALATHRSRQQFIRSRRIHAGKQLMPRLPATIPNLQTELSGLLLQPRKHRRCRLRCRLRCRHRSRLRYRYTNRYRHRYNIHRTHRRRPRNRSHEVWQRIRQKVARRPGNELQQTGHGCELLAGGRARPSLTVGAVPSFLMLTVLESAIPPALLAVQV